MYTIEARELNGHEIFYACFTGKVDLEICKEFVREMEDLERKSPGFNIILDATQVEEYAISAGDIKAIADYIESVNTRTGRTAFISGPSTSRYLMLKLLTVLINTFRGNSDKPFEKLEDAVEWLCPR